MAVDLIVFGPFDVPHDASNRAKRIERRHGGEFWAAASLSDLKRKHGVYVFAVRAARGFVPWYVGRASRGFSRETFTDDKRDKFNRALVRTGKGTPVMFFVAPPGTKNKIPSRELNHMEKELIQYALNRNPDLCNVQNTKNTPEWTIRGVIRSSRGKPSKKARAFKTMMRIGRS